MGKQRLKSLAGLKVAIIGDEQSVCGLILAGAGAVDGQDRKNFHVIDAQTRPADTETAFLEYATNRPDIGVILLTQSAAATIRSTVDQFCRESVAAVPAVCEIPSKNLPYDAKSDPVMQRVQLFFGSTPIMEIDFAAMESIDEE